MLQSVILYTYISRKTLELSSVIRDIKLHWGNMRAKDIMVL